MTRKPLWPDTGWKFVAAAAAAVTIIVICTFNSLLWINRPFPGFFLWQNLFVPPVGGPAWPGDDAGVPYESRLTSVDDEPAESADDVYRGIRHEGPEEDITYTFAAPDTGAQVELVIPTMRLGVDSYLWSLGSYVVIGTLLTLLASPSMWSVRTRPARGRCWWPARFGDSISSPRPTWSVRPGFNRSI